MKSTLYVGQLNKTFFRPTEDLTARVYSGNVFKPNFLAHSEKVLPVTPKYRPPCAPANLYQKQDWNDLLAKTLDVNSMTKILTKSASSVADITNCKQTVL